MNTQESFNENPMTNLEEMETAWWVKIETVQPFCMYYFGPFMNFEEAEKAQPDYLQDLENEQAQGITCNIECSKPLELTRC